jgi:uncharacterized SAM-binding protein YcdF (DUF218 family)
MIFIGRLFAALLIVWSISLGLYVLQINSYGQEVGQMPDAIVVLTGGSNRIEEGLDLMSQHKCQNLFISGVNRDVSRHDILGRIQKNGNVPQCDLELGYTARNTHENAQEVLAWMKKKEFHSMVLVTAHYHMPRSLLEFKAIAPDMIIYPYAVQPDMNHKTYLESALSRSWLVLKEYHKYMAAWLRIYLFQR